MQPLSWCCLSPKGLQTMSLAGWPGSVESGEDGQGASVRGPGRYAAAQAALGTGRVQRLRKISPSTHLH